MALLRQGSALFWRQCPKVGNISTFNRQNRVQEVSVENVDQELQLGGRLLSVSACVLSQGQARKGTLSR